MKWIKIIALLLICCGFICSTCRKDSEDCHHNLTVVNNSNRSIYISIGVAFPDTSITNPNPALSPETRKVPANGRNNWGFSYRDCLEDVFKYQIPSGKLMVYVFDATLLESTSWETVKQNYSVLKRYDLSLQNLKDNSFTVTFP